MFADLAPAFSGPFDRFSKSVVGPEDPRPALSIRALTSDPEALVEKMLRRLAPEASTPQSRRGAASLWTQFYFALVGVPVVLAAMRGRRRLPGGLDEMAVVIGENGLPAALKLPAAGTPQPDRDPRAAMEALITDHYVPAVTAMSRAGRLAPRLLWCNAAVRLVWAMEAAAEAEPEDTDLADIAAAARQAVIASPDLSCGAANPMFDMLLSPKPESGSSYTRKVCCLRYMMPGVADCGETCPLPPCRGS